MAPEEVPPLRPEYLPRPYSWQVYRDSQNPNNPYNLIDAARRVRELQGAPPTPENMASSNANSGISPGFGGRIPAGTARTAQAPQTFAAPPPAPRVPELHLSTDDVRDLFLIVELSQQQAPARFLKEDAQGGLALEVSLAWSDAFDGRFRAAAPEARGPVVLFTVLAHRADAFHPNFTFVQDHDTFRPRIDDPAQMGILEGTLGEIGAEEVVLGYVVLPDRMDPGPLLGRLLERPPDRDRPPPLGEAPGRPFEPPGRFFERLARSPPRRAWSSSFLRSAAVSSREPPTGIFPSESGPMRVRTRRRTGWPRRSSERRICRLRPSIRVSSKLETSERGRCRRRSTRAGAVISPSPRSTPSARRRASPSRSFPATSTR